MDFGALYHVPVEGPRGLRCGAFGRSLLSIIITRIVDILGIRLVNSRNLY